MSAQEMSVLCCTNLVSPRSPFSAHWSSEYEGCCSRQRLGAVL